jgi:uncharacterized membrane protein
LRRHVMAGMTNLGIFHTAISLIAVGAGLIAFVRNRRIVPDSTSGRIYIVTTVITCLTGFGIFEHGGFGKPHVLGIVTLVTLGIAALAGRRQTFGRSSWIVETVAYSATFLFHMIPGVTETSTRLPVGAPLFPNADAPGLQTIGAVLFVTFLILTTIQILWLKGRRAAPLATR